jgi:iron complex transport system substrate-binding protein
MKKVWAFLITAAVGASLLAGCGSSQTASSASAAAASVSAVSTAASASAASGSEASSSESSETESKASSSAASGADSSSSSKPSEDRSGNKITIPDTVDRIISMSPAQTEMLDDLGLIDKVVACDTQSPKYVSDLPAGIPQFDMMSPDNEKITALNPDIVFTSGMSSYGGDDVYQSVRDAGICVADIPSSTSVEGIQEDIQFVADCVGQSQGGEKVIEEMQKSIDEITAIGSKITDKKTVLFEISGSPSIYSVGKDTYIDEMISLIGAKNVMGDQESWISVTDEAAIAANPDVILTGSDQSQNPVGDIMSLPGWENVTAVKNQAVNYINNDSVMIPSEKIVEALREMAVAVYPDEYAAVASEITGNDDGV